jgi:N-acetylglucosamine malate deacetylase 1
MNAISTGELDLLAVGAHPDDAEFWCGGLLAKMSDAGHSVGIVDLSRGELSTGGDLQTRAIEVAAATAELGVAVRENMSFPDGGIGGSMLTPDQAFSAGAQLRAAIALLRRYRPRLLVLPYWRERHPDHAAAGELFTRAAFFSGVRKFDEGGSGSAYTPKQVIYYQMRIEFTPSFIVDVSEAHTRKMAAIAAYRSQLEPPAVGPTPLIAFPMTTRSIEARDGHYGGMIGVSYGEPFLCLNSVPVPDPVRHFCDQRPPALFFPA